MHLKEQKINLMITGATGCGKSSTINALFNTEVARVGVGVDPETMDITKYDLDNLVCISGQTYRQGLQRHRSSFQEAAAVPFCLYNRRNPEN